jgi:pyruvate/2-oxoglutarate dehydrogenase complex dihydrolipoamide acyltransferase (E2) component
MGKLKQKGRFKSMSYRAYARHRGVSPEAVSKAVKTGRITAGPDGKIDPEAADRQWEANTDPVKTRGKAARAEEAPAPGDLPPITRVLTMGMLIDNKIKQTKLHGMEKKVYPLDRIRVDAFNITRIARDTFMNLPDKVSADLVAMDDFHEIHEYLREEVKTIFYDLAEALKNIPAD